MALPFPDIRSNLFDRSGGTSVVTSAAQGIGLASSEGLACAGSAVAMVDPGPGARVGPPLHA